jgi:predicted extracellular nuclease
MKKVFLTISIVFVAQFVFAQKQLFVAFYNQENFFDTIDDPHKNDNEFLPSAKKEWNTEKYLNKVNHMARVVSSMNDGNGADVIGMCEIENDNVLNNLVADKQLKKNKYQFVHYESPDERSIDNALLFNSKKLKLISSIVYPIHFIENPDSKTRDILVVKLEAKNKEQIIFIVNHFPSRLGGQEASEHKRIHVASVLKHICDSISISNPKQGYVIMGDFNDEPTDKSIDSALAAKGNLADVKNANDIFNAMYALKQNGDGSLQYRKKWDMLDQIMMNKPIANCENKVCYKQGSASIYKQDWMLETDEKYKGAPLRTFAGQKYTNGFSDHFPVYLYLELK